MKAKSSIEANPSRRWDPGGPAGAGRTLAEMEVHRPSRGRNGGIIRLDARMPLSRVEQMERANWKPRGTGSSVRRETEMRASSRNGSLPASRAGVKETDNADI